MAISNGLGPFPARQQLATSSNVGGAAAEGRINRLLLRNQPAIKRYGQQLLSALWAGRIIGALHTLCSILAFCNLTWATVVLLGAYINSLHHADFYIVFTLLLLEATRLASSTFFTQLLTLVPNPGHLSCLHPDQEIPLAGTAQYIRLSLLFRLLSSFLQALLISPSFACAAIRFSRIHVYPADVNLNLQESLRIFYVLIILNASLSTAIVLLAFMAWMYFSHLSERSVLRYYDEVRNNAIMEGVAKADNFNFFHFAFGLLGREYASYKSWATVVAEHGGLLWYLYADKMGVEYLQACLESEEAEVRQAAANTVGAWAYVAGKQVELPVELLTRLADMVGTGEVGWAAVNSFGALARSNPGCVIRIHTSGEKPVLHQIAKLVDRHSARCLASVRALVLFYDTRQAIIGRATQLQAEGDHWRVQATSGKRSLGETIKELPREREEEQLLIQELSAWQLPSELEACVVEELEWLLWRSHVQRLRVQAAYLLHMLGRLPFHDADFRDQIKSIVPTHDRHWFQTEKQMLERLFLLMSLGPPPPASAYPHLRPSPETSLIAPPQHFAPAPLHKNGSPT